ncbi:hypothetical protein E2320_013650, partial [Naja naja]
GSMFNVASGKGCMESLPSLASCFHKDQPGDRPPSQELLSMEEGGLQDFAPWGALLAVSEEEAVGPEQNRLEEAPAEREEQPKEGEGQPWGLWGPEPEPDGLKSKEVTWETAFRPAKAQSGEDSSREPGCPSGAAQTDSALQIFHGDFLVRPLKQRSTRKQTGLPEAPSQPCWNHQMNQVFLEIHKSVAGGACGVLPNAKSNIFFASMVVGGRCHVQSVGGYDFCVSFILNYDTLTKSLCSLLADSHPPPTDCCHTVSPEPSGGANSLRSAERQRWERTRSPKADLGPADRRIQMCVTKVIGGGGIILHPLSVCSI